MQGPRRLDPTAGISEPGIALERGTAPGTVWTPLEGRISVRVGLRTCCIGARNMRFAMRTPHAGATVLSANSVVIPAVAAAAPPLLITTAHQLPTSQTRSLYGALAASSRTLNRRSPSCNKASGGRVACGQACSCYRSERRRAPSRGTGQDGAGPAIFPAMAARGMVKRKVADETSASDDDASSTMATAAAWKMRILAMAKIQFL